MTQTSRRPNLPIFNHVRHYCAAPGDLDKTLAERICRGGRCFHAIRYLKTQPHLMVGAYAITGNTDPIRAAELKNDSEVAEL